MLSELVYGTKLLSFIVNYSEINVLVLGLKPYQLNYSSWKTGKFLEKFKNLSAYMGVISE